MALNARRAPPELKAQERAMVSFAGVTLAFKLTSQTVMHPVQSSSGKSVSVGIAAAIVGCTHFMFRGPSQET